MLAETSNSRGSFYSSLYDEYSSRNEERTYTVRKRPSLNLHPRTSSINSLKRQPSFDCPSPVFPNLISSNYSSPPSSLFNYNYRTTSGSFSPTPPNPGYVFTHFNNNVGNNSNKAEERSNSLIVPLDMKRNSVDYHASSLGYHTRSSSVSSYEDGSNSGSNSVEVASTKLIQSQQNINVHIQQQQDKQDSDRDQYGFRRSFQWNTRKEYNEFESSYIQVLHRRKQKWDVVIAENGGVIPDRSSKMRRYVRKGIPSTLRGKAWFHFSGAEAKMRNNVDSYQQLLIKAQDPRYENKYAEIIERDLHRTFPENIKFKSTIVSEDGSTFISTDDVPIIQSLRRVLIAFSLYSTDIDIGYCQSLNYVAGILLLFMEEEKAFWMLVTIINDYLPEKMYDITMEGANADQVVLMNLLMEKLPHLWNRLSGGFSLDAEKLDENMPTISLITSHWFLTLYINILPIETLLRVWDCLFYEGNEVLFRVAIAIIRLNEDKILAVDDPMEMFQVVQNMPKRLLDCHKFMSVCFRRRNDISQKEIDRHRDLYRERRKKRMRSVLFKHHN